VTHLRADDELIDRTNRDVKAILLRLARANVANAVQAEASPERSVRLPAPEGLPHHLLQARK
jgi:hypothetical protein